MVYRVSAFSNMETGWQITNAGTRFLLRTAAGAPVMGGEMTIEDAVVGRKLAPSPGASAPMLELAPVALFVNEGFIGSQGDGTEHDGVVSICLASQPRSPAYDQLECRSLRPGVPREHDDRNHQFINVPVRFRIEGLSARITRWGGGGFGLQGQSGGLGREGTAEAPSASVYHAIYQARKPGGATKDNRSPLVLDMDGSGDVDLLGVWEDGAVAFDLEGDGRRNLTGWVRPQDALLAIDRDGDGRIGDGRELFGDFSWAYDLELTVRRRFANGFAALAQYDSNLDGVFDARDPAFAYVRLWHDRNGDGESQATELTPLADRIRSISLAYTRNTADGRVKLNRGNEVPYVSTFTLVTGETRMIADVYFNQDRDSDVAAAR